MASGGESSSSASKRGMGTGNEVGGSGTATVVDPERQAKILAFVQKRREMREQSATTLESPPSTFTDKDVDNLYKCMECQRCGLIPHPNRRFGCVRGHVFCFDCVKELQVVIADLMSKVPERASSPPFPICMIGIRPEKQEEVGYSHGMLPPWTVDLGPEEKKILEEYKPFGYCLLRLNKLDADPLYTQVFRSTKWKHPSANVMNWEEEKEMKELCAPEGADPLGLDKDLPKCLMEFFSSMK